MKPEWIAILLVTALTACGVDGPPIRPAAEQSQTGVTVSGYARTGVLKE